MRSKVFDPKILSRREVLLMAGAAGMSLLLPGCGGGSSSGTTGGGTTGGGTTGGGTTPAVDLLYFASNRSADGTYHIFSMNPDGSNVTDVAAFDQYEAPTGSSTIEAFDPTQLDTLSCSADGTAVLANYRFILYPIQGDPNLNEGNGDGMLYVSFKSGITHDLLAKLGLMGPAGALSPDGTKILYVPFYQVNGAGAQIAALNIAAVDGSNSTVRYTAPNVNAGLAPLGFGADNATIYAFTTTEINNTGNFSYTYYRLDVGSNTPVKVTTLPSNLGRPTISPNGTQMLSTVYPSTKAEIQIANLDGTNAKMLTNGAQNDTDPVFSHEGTKIYFVSDRDGNDEIYAMNPDGSGVTRLTYNFATDTRPTTRAARRPGRVRLFR
jgi:hypothetical protein